MNTSCSGALITPTQPTITHPITPEQVHYITNKIQQNSENIQKAQDDIKQLQIQNEHQDHSIQHNTIRNEHQDSSI